MEDFKPIALFFSIAYRMLGSGSEAEDIVQQLQARYYAWMPTTSAHPSPS